MDADHCRHEGIVVKAPYPHGMKPVVVQYPVVDAPAGCPVFIYVLPFISVARDGREQPYVGILLCVHGHAVFGGVYALKSALCDPACGEWAPPFVGLFVPVVAVISHPVPVRAERRAVPVQRARAGGALLWPAMRVKANERGCAPLVYQPVCRIVVMRGVQAHISEAYAGDVLVELLQCDDAAHGVMPPGVGEPADEREVDAGGRVMEGKVVK